MNKLTENDLVQAIVDGVEALQGKTRREIRRIIGDDWLIPPSLPAGEGKSISITPAGQKAANLLAAHWRKRSALGPRTSLDEAQKAMAQALANLLLAPEFDTAEAALKIHRINDEVESQVSSLISDVTHYFQVQLFRHSNVDTVTIGPVVLERSELWKARVLDVQDDGVDRSGPGDWFVEASWVGGISDGGRAFERSREHAAASLRLALDAMTLPMTISEARRVRGPSDRIYEYRQVRFSRYQNGFLGYAADTDIVGLTSAADYIDEFLSYQRPFLDLVGDAIRVWLNDPEVGKNKRIVRQWLEALYWFGESRRSRDDFVALVSIGIALDILAGGSRSKGISGMCAGLWGCNSDSPITSDGRSIRKLVDQIYNEGRSRLAHGTRFGLLEEIPVLRTDADRFAALVLRAYLLRLAHYEGADNTEDYCQALRSGG